MEQTEIGLSERELRRHVLHLIKQWLEAPVEEDDGRGHRKRSTGKRDAGRGKRPKVRPSHRCCRICKCDDSFWGGSNWGTSVAGRRISSFILADCRT